MKFRIKGLDEYIKKIDKLSNSFNAEVCLENALQKGGEIVKDETIKYLQKMPVDNRPYVIGMRKSIMEVQRQALIKTFGVTPTMQKKGNMVDVKTGVDGYNKLGQPNVMIARSLEKGTSFMNANPVISRASKNARNKCVEAMQESLNEDIERIMNNQNLRRKNNG